MKLSLLSEGVLSEKKGVVYKYSCVMFEIPDPTAGVILNWGKRNIKEEWVYYDPEDPSLGREDHIHITVKYGLHDPYPSCISELVKDFGEFSIGFGEVSKFESENYDVIKLAISGDRLHELNKLIADNVEYTDKYPEYNPHATIAYVKPGTCDHLLGRRDFDDLTAKCDKVQFSSKAADNKVFLPIC